MLRNERKVLACWKNIWQWHTSSLVFFGLLFFSAKEFSEYREQVVAVVLTSSPRVNESTKQSRGRVGGAQLFMRFFKKKMKMIVVVCGI